MPLYQMRMGLKCFQFQFNIKEWNEIVSLARLIGYKGKRNILFTGKKISDLTQAFGALGLLPGFSAHVTVGKTSLDPVSPFLYGGDVDFRRFAIGRLVGS